MTNVISIWIPWLPVGGTYIENVSFYVLYVCNFDILIWKYQFYSTIVWKDKLGKLSELNKLND